MTLSTLIIIAVVVLLIAIGAANRRKLSLLIRSKAKTALKKSINAVDVLNTRIDQAKLAKDKMIESAGGLKAQEMKLESSREELPGKVSAQKSKAKKYKENGDDKRAMNALKMAMTYTKQLESVDINIAATKEARENLEFSIDKLKAAITEYKIKIKDIESRQTTNDALKAANTAVGSSIGETIGESIDELDDLVSTESNKINYVSSFDEEEDEEMDSKLAEEFKNL